MIDIISWNRNPIEVSTYSSTSPIKVGYKFQITFILFGKMECSCEFESINATLDVKEYIENMLRDDFNNSIQLEGKPSNLKTK